MVISGTLRGLFFIFWISFEGMDVHLDSLSQNKF